MNNPNDPAKLSKDQVQGLLDGLKSEAAKAGIEIEVEDLDDEFRVGIQTYAELLRFVNLASCAGPLVFRFDAYLPVEQLVEVVSVFLNHNEGPGMDQPPATL